MPIPAGVQAKLDRADLHIAELGTALQPLLPQCVTAIRTETYNGVEYEELYVSKLPVLGADLGCIVGDALHNLRSALDHMAEALVRASGETPTRHTAFPVRKPGKTTPKIDGGGSIPPKALTIIERVQPDHDPAHASPLAQLVALNNIDKHRSVLLAAFRSEPDTPPGRGRDAMWNPTTSGHSKKALSSCERAVPTRNRSQPGNRHSSSPSD